MSKIERKQDNCIKTTFDWIDFGLFLVLLLGYIVAVFLNFRQQALGLVESDMEAYIKEMLGTNDKYPFSYPLYFKFGALIHLFVKSPEMSMAIAVTILCGVSIFALRYFLEADEQLRIRTLPFCREVTETSAKRTVWGMCVAFLQRFGNTLMTFALSLLSMLFVPTGFRFPGVKFDYVGVFSPNPFHNATYNAAKPFTIVAFFLFARILAYYDEEIRWKDFGLFSLFLFLATLTKPSFTLIFVSTAGLVMLARLFLKKWKNLKNSILLGLMFVPTFALLLYQFFGVFGPVEEGERGIGVSLLKVWGQYCENVPMAIFLAAAFPIVYMVLTLLDRCLDRKKDFVREPVLGFAMACYLVSLVEFIVFYEKGFRMVDANFSWGYMAGLFFLFVTTGKALLTDTIEGRKKLWQLLLLWMFFAAHLCCGLCYIVRILMGNSYY